MKLMTTSSEKRRAKPMDATSQPDRLALFTTRSFSLQPSTSSLILSFRVRHPKMFGTSYTGEAYLPFLSYVTTWATIIFPLYEAQ